MCICAVMACLGDALGFFSLTFFLPEHRAIKAISPSLLQLVRTSHVRSWKRQDTKKQTGAPAVQASVVRRQKMSNEFKILLRVKC